jgi:hypothetical protein
VGLSPGELIAAVGGMTLLIAMLLPWYERDTDVAGVHLAQSWNAWQILSLIAVLLFAIGVAAIAIPALRVLWEPAAGLGNGRLLTLVGALGVGLVLLRLVVVPTPDIELVAGDSSDTGRAPGVFLALVATAAIAYGGRRSTSSA